MAARAPQRARRLSPSKLREHVSTPLYTTAYLLIVTAFSTSLLGLPFWALAGRHYSARNVGQAAAMISALSLVSGIAQLGMTGVLPRYLPASGLRTRRFVLITYAAAGTVSLFLGLAAAATAGLWSPSLGYIADQTSWFALFVVMTVASTISVLQDSVMTGLRQARWVPVENISFGIAKIALVILLASSHPKSGVALAWMIPLVGILIPVNLAIFVRFIPAHVRRTAGGIPGWRRADLRKLVIGNFAGDFSGLFIAFFLPVLVLNLAGARQAAFFFVPWTISMGIRLVAQNMATSMTVEAGFDETRRREHLRGVVIGTARLLLPIVAVVLLAAPQILGLFGHSYARTGSLTLRLLVIATLPHAVSMLGLGLARVHHDGRFVAIVEVSDAILMLVLSIVLVPAIGIEGAATGWLVAQVLAAVLCVPRIWRAYRGGRSDSSSAGETVGLAGSDRAPR